MEEPKERVNIYLNGNNKEKVLEGTSPQERYIIIMNETLHIENKEHKELIKNLEVRNEELENDSDKAETSKRYMIGLLKNFVEIDKMKNEIVDKNNNINKLNKLYINTVQNKARQHLRYLNGLLFTIFAIIWEIGFYSFEQFSAIVFIVVFIMAFIVRLIENIILPSYEIDENKIEDLFAEVKKITDAQDYLHEYLDSI